MTKVYITVPCQHWVHKAVSKCLVLLHVDGRYKIRMEWPSHKPYENNLHHIVVEFLKSDCDYWLSIDSDNPPVNNPLDLVELDLDVVGLPTPIWHNAGKKGERPVYWSAYDYASDVDAYREHQVRDGLQQVDAIGTGCFLIARRVFEHPEMQKGAFIRKLYPDGTVHKGNDMSFCERVKGCGFTVWAHFGYPCKHFSELELNEVVGAFRGMYE